jgi:hypothetical protein
MDTEDIGVGEEELIGHCLEQDGSFAHCAKGFETASHHIATDHGDDDDDSDSDDSDESSESESSESSSDGGGEPPPPEDTIYGVPLAIEFDAGTLVDLVLINVDNNWIGDADWLLDVEITGLNGGFEHHGNQLFSVAEGTVFNTGPNSSEVVFDWTTDTTPQSVNEVYTVCSQVLYVYNGSPTPVGTEKCTSMGPF